PPDLARRARRNVESRSRCGRSAKQRRARCPGILAGLSAGQGRRQQNHSWRRRESACADGSPRLVSGALSALRGRRSYQRRSPGGLPQSSRLSSRLATCPSAMGGAAGRDGGTFQLAGAEPEPAVRIVLGHWLFGYIHPYPDGNGRMARFFMNAMLASGGYPWTVIRVMDRKSYLSALDRASIEMDIHPFSTFIVRRVQWRLN